MFQFSFSLLQSLRRNMEVLFVRKKLLLTVVGTDLLLTNPLLIKNYASTWASNWIG
jgi:hypothetical protein